MKRVALNYIIYIGTKLLLLLFRWIPIKKIDRIIENYIRDYPEQWFWFHKRWRTDFKH